MEHHAIPLPYATVLGQAVTICLKVVRLTLIYNRVRRQKKKFRFGQCGNQIARRKDNNVTCVFLGDFHALIWPLCSRDDFLHGVSPIFRKVCFAVAQNAGRSEVLFNYYNQHCSSVLVISLAPFVRWSRNEAVNSRVHDIEKVRRLKFCQHSFSPCVFLGERRSHVTYAMHKK